MYKLIYRDKACRHLDARPLSDLVWDIKYRAQHLAIQEEDTM